jgi:hypothetical protein
MDVPWRAGNRGPRYFGLREDRNCRVGSCRHPSGEVISEIQCDPYERTYRPEVKGKQTDGTAPSGVSRERQKARGKICWIW